ncbi:hypothetical protein ACH4E9_10085 [Streptomyces anulatus]|uniref:hypothetical protein n=1 Tax=Streptomyces anulatus TaxID=1892 RepID=UPI002250490C|nr:hypothetical protein [Streptomyces anulatus]MCX4501288.1 hypothetical protein [Streptomyces anulatus]
MSAATPAAHRRDGSTDRSGEPVGFAEQVAALHLVVGQGRRLAVQRRGFGRVAGHPRQVGAHRTLPAPGEGSWSSPWRRSAGHAVKSSPMIGRISIGSPST